MKVKSEKIKDKSVFKKIRGNLSLISYLLSPSSGQVVLILVLVTIVGLTIGLSLISRTVTDIRISSQIEQSSRAFSAAEAGVESALKGAVIGGPTGTVSLSDSSAKYSVSALGGSSSVYYFPYTESSTIQTLWLMPHNTDGVTLNETGPWGNPEDQPYPTSSSLDICFGSGTTGNPAIVIGLFYKDGADYKFVKSAYDSVVRGNKFNLADLSGSYCDAAFRFKKTITATTDFGIAASAKLLMLRIQVIYDGTVLSIKPAVSTPLPIQGKLITSLGKTDTGVVRKIQVNSSFPVLPFNLDFTLFVEN